MMDEKVAVCNVCGKTDISYDIGDYEEDTISSRVWSVPDGWRSDWLCSDECVEKYFKKSVLNKIEEARYEIGEETRIAKKYWDCDIAEFSSTIVKILREINQYVG